MLCPHPRSLLGFYWDVGVSSDVCLYNAATHVFQALGHFQPRLYAKHSWQREFHGSIFILAP